MRGEFDAKGYYDVLEVSYSAPLSLIKQQYYDRAKFWHPDRNEAPNALEIFQKISVAYDILKDAKSRLIYDLLCLVYTEKDFPQIGALKIYKNQSGHDDLALRVLRQRSVVQEMKGSVIKETKDICNFREAKEMVVSTSVANWLKGWWGRGAFKKNIEAIKFNMQAVYADDTDNLKLLIHNAVAYEQEKHIDSAWVYAKQAQLLSTENPRAQMLLAQYIDMLDFHPQKAVALPYWSAKALLSRQKIIPGTLALVGVILVLGLLAQAGLIKMPTHEKTSYYEQRQFGGVLVPYDMIDSHIVKVDGDISSTEYLYHLKNDAIIYYGPDERYDPMAKVRTGKTIRVIGYTPNKAWVKIMIDNGDTGYLPAKVLEQGIGNPLPARTRIYKSK